MVLYFPVSALVTLFGHILQNPLDPRARSDTKLMNVVVNFLSTLGQEAETGGVHRMLGVCSEFERIAKVVIEKAEKEHASRRKRKNQDQPPSKPTTNPGNANTSAADSASFNPNVTRPTSRPSTASATTPQGTSANHTVTGNRGSMPSLGTDNRSSANESNNNNNISSGGGSNVNSNGNSNGSKNNGYNSVASTTSQSPSPELTATGWGQVGEFTPDNSEYSKGSFAADMTSFDPLDTAMAGAGMESPPLMGPDGELVFQQPMLPQDLFSLPMTLDWNWAEMSGGAYPSVENGNFGGGGIEGMSGMTANFAGGGTTGAHQHQQQQGGGEGRNFRSQGMMQGR